MKVSHEKLCCQDIFLGETASKKSIEIDWLGIGTKWKRFLSETSFCKSDSCLRLAAKSPPCAVCEPEKSFYYRQSAVTGVSQLRPASARGTEEGSINVCRAQWATRAWRGNFRCLITV